MSNVVTLDSKQFDKLLEDLAWSLESLNRCCGAKEEKATWKECDDCKAAIRKYLRPLESAERDLAQAVELLRGAISWRDAVSHAKGDLACAQANQASEETARKRLALAIDGDSEIDERIRAFLARKGK